MSASFFTDDFKNTSYWWDRTPLVAKSSLPLADSVNSDTVVDVLVIGAGYTGLHAAIQTARAGMSTVVLDAEAAGYGCSTRNGGQISTSIKYGYKALSQKFDDATAKDILATGQASLDYIGEFIRTENIDCHYQTCGRFHGAHSANAFQTLRKEIDAYNPVFDNQAYMVSEQDQRNYLGTDAYFGGAMFPTFASVDPGRYHQGCLAVAQKAGAKVISYCPVIDYKRRNGVFTVQSTQGVVRAKQLIVATNGYTGSLTPWHRRRVIPIGSYIIATDEIDDQLMHKIMPSDSMLTDSRKLVYYYRPSPDRKRVLFGGRVSLNETNAKKSAVLLREELVRLFPELSNTRVSHSWSGTVAYTFDSLMHCGENSGVHFAMGYCGSGVGMAGYLGRCIGESVAGVSSEHTKLPLAKINFPTKPFYTGVPWFLAASVWLYRLRDKLT